MYGTATRLVTGKATSMSSGSKKHPHFRPTRWRAGYRPEEVDAFVDVVEDALRSPTPRVSASDVSQHRFTPVRLMAGYDPDDVDAYLDKVQRELDQRKRRR
jgi:DivIVA domain-containing protein